MPHRVLRDWTLALRPLRRGRGFVATGDQLLVTAPPPAVFRTRVFGGGASLQLATAAGTPIARAGVDVRVAVLGGAGLTSIPQPATTDAGGIATFDALALIGPLGTYSLVFSASGYQSATVPGLQLVAGLPNAAQTTADVPGGSVGRPLVVEVQLRDSDGNAILVDPGGVAITVAITGPNAAPAAAATYADLGVWTFGYTPTAPGDDTLTIRMNGAAINGSPFLNRIAIESASNFDRMRSLRVGMNNYVLPDDLGTGPTVVAGAWPRAEPAYRATVGNVLPGQLAAVLAAATTYDVLLAFTVAGSPGGYDNPDGTYNETLYRQQVDRYKSTAQGGQLSAADALAFAQALATRQAMLYIVDEPWHLKWQGSLWPYYVKRMAQYVRGIWPNALVGARMEPQYVHGGWSTSLAGNLMPDGVVATNLPVRYFDKIDYMWCTFRGFDRAPSKGYASVRDFFTWGVGLNAQYGYGTMLAHNWLNLGDGGDCFDYDDPLDATYTGTQRAHIHGDDSRTGQAGVAERCTVVTSDTLWAESPARIRDVASAAADPAFANVPALFCYAHPRSGIIAPAFTNHLQSAAYVSAWTDAVRAGEARATDFRWRTPA